MPLAAHHAHQNSSSSAPLPFLRPHTVVLISCFRSGTKSVGGCMGPTVQPDKRTEKPSVFFPEDYGPASIVKVIQEWFGQQNTAHAVGKVTPESGSLLKSAAVFAASCFSWKGATLQVSALTFKSTTPHAGCRQCFRIQYTKPCPPAPVHWCKVQKRRRTAFPLCRPRCCSESFRLI